MPKVTEKPLVRSSQREWKMATESVNTELEKRGRGESVLKEVMGWIKELLELM